MIDHWAQFPDILAWNNPGEFDMPLKSVKNWSDDSICEKQSHHVFTVF